VRQVAGEERSQYSTNLSLSALEVALCSRLFSLYV
jgi:hypothetical protein